MFTAAHDLAELDPLKEFSNACRQELRLIEQQLYGPA
jgi:hypothetical protein